MGKRHREREAYKYLAGLSDTVSIAVLKMWDRHNFDWGEFRALRKYKREQQAKKDLRNLTTEVNQ